MSISNKSERMHIGGMAFHANNKSNHSVSYMRIVKSV